jgi:DNA-binding Lrp family transcriptional regulator
VKTVVLTIDSLKEGVARKGTRATELFIRLKPLFVSGYIKDFKNTINPQKFGYSSMKVMLKDMRKLHDLYWIKARDRRTKGKIVTDVQLVGVNVIHKRVIEKSKKSCVISLDPESKILRETIHAAILQDLFYKQQYKSSKSSQTKVKPVLIINTEKMDFPQPTTVDQDNLTKVSFKTMAKKLGYKSSATAHKVMERMIELGFFKKFNQIVPDPHGHRFKNVVNVRVLCNVYEVVKSVLPPKNQFLKMFS